MKKTSNWRINTVLVIFFILGAGILSRLFFLQVIERKLFESQALGQQIGVAKVTGSRGQVFCQSSQTSKGGFGTGEIKSLAANKESWTIFANPEKIEDKEAFAKLLSPLIEESEEDIIFKLDATSNYVILKRELTEEEILEIRNLELKGLSWEKVSDRFYPQGELGSQVVGFLGGEKIGQYGIEGFYDELLQGKTGIKEEKSGLDSLFSSANELSLEGSDIYLTIDYNIQFQAESILERAGEKLSMESGQIIVMKPDSGRILAIANYPNFDPNNYSKERDLEIFQNSTVQKLFEPGSIMKPFTMAAAINEGKITKDSTYVDEGFLKFGKDQIHNFANEVYGTQTMTQVLENSINTGAVYAQKQISHDTFLDYLDKFGFFKKTGIDLQGEVYSRNELLKIGPDFNFATASFGQGIELTPIQIATGFCSLANGGKMVKPYIVDKIINGDDVLYINPGAGEQVLSKQTVSQVTSMLVNVVDNGFNSVAKIPGYYLAGKTGTAQVPLKNGKGYEPDKTIQSFVGYGPAYNPQFLILVKLDDPKVSKSALSAVPVFKELAQYIINYWKLAPDYSTGL